MMAEVLTLAADLLDRGEQHALVPALAAAASTLVPETFWQLGRLVRRPDGSLEWVPNGETVDPGAQVARWTAYHLGVQDLAAWAAELPPAQVAEALRGCARFRFRAWRGF